MKIEVRAPGTHWSSDVGGYRITEWSDVDELLAFRDERRVAEPATQLLFVLDDGGQAAYTSGHACDMHKLCPIDPEALPADERALYEEGGRLTAERWASVVVPRLRALAEESTLSFDVQLISIADSDVALLELYRDPSRAFQSPLDCLAVRAAEPSMAIAALPNGYFEDDLTPTQNYLLAEHLRTRFGYEVLGLGSYLAAYVREKPVSADEAHAIVESVRGLYGMSDTLAAEWARAITGLRWLLLSYRGN